MKKSRLGKVRENDRLKRKRKHGRCRKSSCTGIAGAGTGAARGIRFLPGLVYGRAIEGPRSRYSARVGAAARSQSNLPKYLPESLRMNISTCPQLMVGDPAVAAPAEPPRLAGPDWCVVHRDGPTAAVYIKNEIGIFGKTAETVLDEIKDAERIELFINSTGGSSLSALKLYDGFSGRVSQATISARCYSSAVIIALSAPTIRIEANARMMVHTARDFVFGNEDELQGWIPFLRKVNARFMNLVAARCGGQSSAWFGGGDFYFTAEEAVANHLANEIFIFAEPRVTSPLPSTATGESSRGQQMTADETLFFDFLRAFNSIEVRSRARFVANVSAFLNRHCKIT